MLPDKIYILATVGRMGISRNVDFKILAQNQAT
jgi:hypothetical protein